MSLDALYRLSLIMNMVDNLSGPMAGVRSSVNNSVTSLQSFQSTLGDMTKTGATMAGLGSELTKAVLEPAMASFGTERALGELSSLGVRNLALLENAARKFSGQWAGTTTAEFITAAYDIKSGIASLTDQGIADYTMLAGMTAKATKSTTAEMTSLFASGYGIYKNYYSNLTDLQFGEVFSSGISESVRAFKTSGSGMASAIQTLGASATTAQVPLEEQLAILGMLQATMGGSEAGTKYKAFLRSAVKGGQELGLSFMDANNQLLSMPQILGILRGKFGETMDAAEKLELQKAFGDAEAVALIDLMYSKTGDLQSNILNLYGAMSAGMGITQQMADAINSTNADRYVTLNQRAQNLKETLGTLLSPTIGYLLDKGEQLITKTAVWISQNPELAKNIMLIVLALGGFLTVSGTTIAVFGTFGLIISKTISGFIGFISTLRKIPTAIGILKTLTSGIFGLAKQAITTAATALPGLIASVWSFTAALLANPITWIVIGIIALIAAIILLWKNWDSVTAWIKGVWDSFVNGIKAGFDWITNLFSGMPLWLQIALAVFMPFVGIPLLIITHWDAIVGFFTGLWTRVSGAFVTGIDNIKNWFLGIPEWFRQSGAKIVETLTEGIKSAAMKPVEAVTGIFQKVRDFLPFSDAKVGPLSTLTLSGTRTMSTIAEGMKRGENLPANAVERSFKLIDTDGGEALGHTPVKKVSLRGGMSGGEPEADGGKSASRGVFIEKLLFNVDFKNIKDLPKLMALLAEIEDYVNSNGFPEEAPA